MRLPVAVILSGSGVYDGSEIHESVLTLLSLSKRNIAYQCIAPNMLQHHVINHTSGEEMDESRNVLVEAARIARGEIKDIADVSVNDFAGLIMPGGFGAAKNLTKWAFEGPDGSINESIASLIRDFVQSSKPIVAMCMSPVVVAKAFENTEVEAALTVGTTEEASPYDIKAISEGMNSIGSNSKMRSVREVSVDMNNKIITTPCYMMEASISEVYSGIEKAIESLEELL